MWNASASLVDLFDAAMPRGDRLAQSALDWNLSWTGLPHDPPLELQPGVLAWSEAHLMWALALQYEATRDAKYLRALAERFDRLLALRDDRTGRVDVKRGRVMPAWGSVLFSGGHYTAFLCHAGNLTFPAAGFVRIVYADPALHSEFGPTARRFERAIRETIDAYDHEWHDGPDPMEGHYTDTSLWDRNLPLNQQNMLGRAMLELAVATGDEKYFSRARRLAIFFKRRIRIGPRGALVWPYFAPLDADAAFDRGEDLSHAAANADFAWMCCRAGVVFDAQDMQRLALTLTESLHRPLAGVGGDWAGFICGSGPDNAGRVASYWGRVATHAPAAIASLHRYYFSLNPPITGPFALLTLAMLGWAQRETLAPAHIN